MSFEKIFIDEFSKKMQKCDSPQNHLEHVLPQIKDRFLEMNAAIEKMSASFKTILETLEVIYPNLRLQFDPNLFDSHHRMARALIEICSGLGADVKEVLEVSYPTPGYGEMVMLKDIEFTSLCAHHFYPFSGKAHVAYLPHKGHNEELRVVGISKLARVVDIFALRPQIQERLTIQIMEAIRDELKPDGVIVIIEGEHTCLSCRGAKKKNSSMITISFHGKFQESESLREEFLSLIGKKIH